MIGNQFKLQIFICRCQSPDDSNNVTEPSWTRPWNYPPGTNYRMLATINSQLWLTDSHNPHSDSIYTVSVNSAYKKRSHTKQKYRVVIKTINSLLAQPKIAFCINSPSKKRMQIQQMWSKKGYKNHCYQQQWHKTEFGNQSKSNWHDSHFANLHEEW